jgi:MerR family transcriptional regulator, light-induced transcriptional regulator
MFVEVKYMDSKSLTTKEVARLCRVSDATVKRWEIDGLIRSERTKGGHRRFRAEEIARFQQQSSLGVQQHLGDESSIKIRALLRSDKDLSDCTFFHSLIAGCEQESGDRLISEYINGTTLTEIFDGLISRTMTHIGELWYRGQLSVAQEHLATHTVIAAIYKLRHAIEIKEPCNKLAICCAFEGDFHELPAHLAQMTFESEGWEVMNFGANTPLFSLAEEVARHTPEIVCISSTVMDNIERAARDYREFREKTARQKLKVMLGGQTFRDKNILGRFPAALYPASFTEVRRIARQYAV